MHYYILSVSKNRAQFFEVNDNGIFPKNVEGMPSGIADAFSGMERQDQSVNFHTGAQSNGDATAIFHGQGGAKDVEEQEEDKYMHMLAKSVHSIVHGGHAPLVFAGVTEEYGMFKKFDQSGMLLEEYIHGSPEQTSMDELKAKADPLVKDYLMHMNEKHLEEYGNLQGTGRTSADASAIAEAAANGKVDVLLVAEGSEDTAKEITAHTLEHRGRAFVIDAAKMPEEAKMAAILRF